MTTGQLVEMLKVDLGITTTAYDERLAEYVKSAQTEITRQGATLDDSSVSDAQLVVMYAAWMWRRRDTGDGMPRMIRYALNNKIFSGKISNG